MQNLWFSIFDFSFKYPGSESAFAEPSEFPWTQELSAATPQILAELKAYLSENHLDSYFNSSMVAKKGSWKTIALKTWSVELYKNQKKFPRTTAIINKYPEIISASFNMLEPGGHIVPHCGDTNAIYRAHLGLSIPASAPTCGFRVREETRSWQEGKWLIFIDAYEHEAWNNSDRPRYIFLIDAIRKEFQPQKGLITSTVLSSLFLQKRAEKLSVFSGKNSERAAKILTTILRPFAWTAIKACNVLKIY